MMYLLPDFYWIRKYMEFRGGARSLNKLLALCADHVPINLTQLESFEKNFSIDNMPP